MDKKRRKTKAELDEVKGALPFRFVYYVRERATVLGLDMSTLSRKSGVSREAIRRYWKDDVQKPDAETLGKLVQALGCEPGEIVQFVRNDRTIGAQTDEDHFG